MYQYRWIPLLTIVLITEPEYEKVHSLCRSENEDRIFVIIMESLQSHDRLSSSHLHLVHQAPSDIKKVIQ